MSEVDRSGARRRLFGRKAQRAGAFAMIQPHRGTFGSAALRKIEDVDKRRSRDVNWQSMAYELVEAIGEIGYVLNLKASMVAACNLQPQKWNPTDRVWENTDDDRVLRVMSAFVGPYGGQTELKRRAALHLSIGGESILLGTPTTENTVETGIWWEFLSTEELKISPEGVTRNRDGSGTREPVPTDAYTARLWRPHPRFSDLADSEMRRSLELAQEVQLHGQMIQAALRTRLPAGLLFLPDEVDFIGSDDPDGTGEDDIDAFVNDLMEHLSAPIEDRASAASLVPLVMRGPAGVADGVRLIDLARDIDNYAQQLRQEALGRLAQSLDAPPEVMTGKGGVNHWTGFNLDVDLVTKHIAPPGRLLADFVTFAYQRPMLQDFEGMDEVEAAMYRLSFDASPVIARQDEAGAARTLHAQGPDIVSNDVLRKTNGFDDDAKPEDDEVFQRRAWDLIQKNPAMFAKALLPKIKGFEDIDPELFSEPAPEEPPKPGEEPEADDTEGQGSTPSTDRQPGTTDGDRALEGTGQLVARLSAAADAAVERAVERASSRVATKASKHPALHQRMAGVHKPQTLSVLRPSDLATLGTTPSELTAGAWDSLAVKARAWIGEELRSKGLDPMLADDRAALASGQLAAALDEWLLANLHRPVAFGTDGTIVPLAIVFQALGDLAVVSRW